MADAEKEHKDAQLNDETGVYEDEINLFEYLLVVFKYKWFIMIASVLPAMFVGAHLYFSPRTYEVSYVYDNIRPTQVAYNVLLSQIYSKQNLDKIVNSLRENDFGEYASRLHSADAPEELFKLAPSPAYIDISKQKITDPDQIRQFQGLTAQTDQRQSFLPSGDN